VPTWDLPPSNPAVESQGLNQNELIRILNEINSNAASDFSTVWRPWYKTLVFVPCFASSVGTLLFFIGIIMIIVDRASSTQIDPDTYSFDDEDDDDDDFSLPSYFFIGIGVTCICGIVQFLLCAGVDGIFTRAQTVALENMRQYVEGTLNEQWQSSRNIRWTIDMVQTIHVRHGSGVNKTKVRNWYDIHATSLVQVVQQIQYVQVVGGSGQPVQYVQAGGQPVQTVVVQTAPVEGGQDAQSGQTIQYKQGGQVTNMPVQYMQT